ncbi:alkaline phosphatase isoform X2 [Phlebotomus argentipes]|nr:alkaline phosphatase isoform X2 [Phlebotomus argentipes]XP_059610746.1 alkaline phosphatase isoform X2 [Phlebotomus argentipes]
MAGEPERDPGTSTQVQGPRYYLKSATNGRGGLNVYVSNRRSSFCEQQRDGQNSFSFRDFLKSKLFVSILIVGAVFITLICIGLVVMYERDGKVTQTIDVWRDKLTPEQLVWFESGLDELKNALTIQSNTKRAKNVILFVGDGMGPVSTTAGRIFKHGEGGRLSWESFPHMGLLKTYATDKQVPDSSSTATALFGGVKANYNTNGVDSGVPFADCQASLNKSHHVESILHWAQKAGKGTGFVTTTRVTHATPASLYANVADRAWECDATVPQDAKRLGCLDIARQLVEEDPGQKLNVIMGGGRQCLVSGVEGSAADPLDTWSCNSVDGRDLIEKWRNDKIEKEHSHVVLQNNSDLANFDESSEYVLGIFANGHLKYEDERDKGEAGMPSLENMTAAALRVLRRHQNGFFLVVEGGMIDQAHHRGWAKRALTELAMMDDAVAATLKIMARELDETLIIVTADHAHTLSLNGYPEKGSSVFGVAQNSRADNIPYTTLTYATGGPDGFQVDVDGEGKARRRDPTLQDTEGFTYVQQVGILTDENTHGGVDVAVHAMGPMAHLFHCVHENSYVAHVISYAARIGRFRDSSAAGAFFNLLGLS